MAPQEKNLGEVNLFANFGEITGEGQRGEGNIGAISEKNLG